MTTLSSDHEGLIAPYFEQANRIQIQPAEVDPDMKRFHYHPRFKTMVAAARARLDMADGSQAVQARQD